MPKFVFEVLRKAPETCTVIVHTDTEANALLIAKQRVDDDEVDEDWHDAEQYDCSHLEFRLLET